MNILICIKPDISGQQIGPLEALAVEAGLQLRENCGKGRVDVITVGPSQWVNIIQRGMGMGADNAFHILTERTENGRNGLVSASETAFLLSTALTWPDFTPHYDLIFTGTMSQDLMAGQVGPMLAAHLGRPFASAVSHVTHKAGRLSCFRDWEAGRRETLEMPVPALVAIQSGQYIARYPSLSNLLKATAAEIQTITPQEMGVMQLRSAPIVMDAVKPERKRRGQMASGSIESQVKAFTTFLKERALL